MQGVLVVATQPTDGFQLDGPLLVCFPETFDFAPGRFAVLRVSRGLRLVMASGQFQFLILGTSDSRMCGCTYLDGTAMECERVDLHYTPDADQLAHARQVIAAGLERLYRPHDDT